MYHTTSYYIILLRINYTNYHTLSNTKIEIRKCRSFAWDNYYILMNTKKGPSFKINNLMSHLTCDQTF